MHSLDPGRWGFWRRPGASHPLWQWKLDLISSSMLDALKAVFFRLETDWILEDVKGYTIVYLPYGSRELNQNQHRNMRFAMQRLMELWKGLYSFMTPFLSSRPASILFLLSKRKIIPLSTLSPPCSPRHFPYSLWEPCILIPLGPIMASNTPGHMEGLCSQ